MYLSLNKAAKEAGISKSTLSEALNNGRLTAEKDDRGRWKIDPAALFQVFPKTSSNEHLEPIPNTEPNVEKLLEIERLRAELKAERRVSETMSATIDDLRERLDQADTDRRKTEARLEDLRDKRDIETQQAIQKAATEAENSSSGGLFGFSWGKKRAGA